MHKPLDQRTQHILTLLIQRYIDTGLPVGSKTLAEQASLNLSPATIRNSLAELEEDGYLTSPHASAGRIPTAKGYRFFVDHLAGVKPLANEAIQALKSQLSPQPNLSTLLLAASNVLSNLTHMISVVTLPSLEEESKDYILAGQVNVLNFVTDVDLDRLRSLFDACIQKQKVLTLLNQVLASGIQIFIGQESGYEVFDPCSIVTAAYSIEGRWIGRLGVIGPSRMPYDRVISTVEGTAKLLSVAALNPA